jgi:hypothetical protein
VPIIGMCDVVLNGFPSFDKGARHVV